VWFGSTPATKFILQKEGEIGAVSPPLGTGTYDVTVESILGRSPVTPSDQFTYGPGAIVHWYTNAVKATEAEEIPIVMYGNEVNVSETGPGEINCKTVGGGTIDNPVGGGAGEGRTNSLAFYECKDEMCEKEILAKFGVPGRATMTTQNNPGATKEPAFPGWTNLLEENTVGGVTSIRAKIGEPFVTFKSPSPPGMFRKTRECTIAPTGQVASELIYEGELKPEIGVAKTGNLNGSSAGVPSQFKFNGASTGLLHSESGFVGQFSGNLKYLGYFHQEVITVKP
jgi:hypothetical protein